MSLRNTPERYGWLAKIFHWGMALLIIFMLILGIRLDDMELSPDKITWIGWHKTIGILILMLVVLRFIWRGVGKKVQPLRYRLLSLLYKQVTGT